MKSKKISEKWFYYLDHFPNGTLCLFRIKSKKKPNIQNLGSRCEWLDEGVFKHTIFTGDYAGLKKCTYIGRTTI